MEYSTSFHSITMWCHFIVTLNIYFHREVDTGFILNAQFNQYSISKIYSFLVMNLSIVHLKITIHYSVTVNSDLWIRERIVHLSRFFSMNYLIRFTDRTGHRQGGRCKYISWSDPFVVSTTGCLVKSELFTIWCVFCMCVCLSYRRLLVISVTVRLQYVPTRCLYMCKLK